MKTDPGFWPLALHEKNHPSVWDNQPLQIHPLFHQQQQSGPYCLGSGKAMWTVTSRSPAAFASPGLAGNTDSQAPPCLHLNKRLGGYGGVGIGVKVQEGLGSQEIPWTEEPGGIQSMGSHRVGHDRAIEQQQSGLLRATGGGGC